MTAIESARSIRIICYKCAVLQQFLSSFSEPAVSAPDHAMHAILHREGRDLSTDTGIFFAPPSARLSFLMNRGIKPGGENLFPDVFSDYTMLWFSG